MTNEEKQNHYCDNIECNHNDTKGLCCLFNPDNCKYRQLQKENTKLKSECRTCVYTDSPCVRSDYPNKNGVCDHYKNVFDENAELKARVEKQNSDILFLKHLTEEQRLKIEALEGQTPWKEIKNKSEVIGKLTKAKELIKRLMHELVVSNIPYDEVELLVKDVEQFLKG